MKKVGFFVDLDSIKSPGRFVVDQEKEIVEQVADFLSDRGCSVKNKDMYMYGKFYRTDIDADGDAALILQLKFPNIKLIEYDDLKGYTLGTNSFRVFSP